MERTKEWTLDDMSKDILRQRNKIEIDTKQMSEDIAHYFKKIFKEVNITKYTFSSNYTIALNGTRDLIRFLTYDEKNDTFLVGFVLPDRNVKLTTISPLEQARLFDYFVADIRDRLVYVVMEELFDQQTFVSILGTFKRFETAEKSLKDRVYEQKYEKNPIIWVKAENEKVFEKRGLSFIDESSHYYVCTKEYYYDIKIIPQKVL